MHGTLRGHHNPSTIRKTESYMEPERSHLAHKMVKVGKLIEEQVKVFHIETTVNNRMFGKPLDILARTKTTSPMRNGRGCRAGSHPQVAAPERPPGIFEKVPAPYEMIAVAAGACEPVHDYILEACEKRLVPIEGQADIGIFPIPYISPYNVGAFLNPILVSVMTEGYLHNLHKGSPIVKKGGTMIIFHPCTDKFDQDQHQAYAEFFHKLLPQTRDAMELHKRFERDFSKHPGYVQQYRTGKAYHPVHPFYMWYWGENGRAHRGRVIVVGADNEYVLASSATRPQSRSMKRCGWLARRRPKIRASPVSASVPC